MMDIVRFQDFLASLAEISCRHFEIWEGRNAVFATSPGGPTPDGLDALAAAIMSGGNFHQKTRDKEMIMAGVPLREEEEIVGALIVWSTDSPNGSPSNAGTMEVFLRRLAGLLEDGWTSRRETEKLAEDLTQSFEDLYLYAHISSWVKTMRFSDSMLQNLIYEITETMRVDLAFVRLEKRRDGDVLIGSNKSRDRVADKPAFVESLLGAIPKKAPSLEERYFIVNDSRSVPGYGALHAEPFRTLMVMIQDEENFYGWLGVLSFNMDEIFRRSELRLLISIAEQVAVVISNTNLYHELQSFVINVVKSLVYAIEAKDTYTRGHSERVSRYSMLLAERLNLPENEKEYLQWASILHDVGKIGIPEAILTKPAHLTKAEFELVKEHPAKGYNILTPLEPMTGSLLGILHHHERFDGDGYPGGLRGEEIPLLARIIAVADTFDAINSDRAYRLAKPHYNAMAIVESLAGKQLDPKMVGIFSEIIKETGGIPEGENDENPTPPPFAKGGGWGFGDFKDEKV